MSDGQAEEQNSARRIREEHDGHAEAESAKETDEEQICDRRQQPTKITGVTTPDVEHGHQLSPNEDDGRG